MVPLKPLTVSLLLLCWGYLGIPAKAFDETYDFLSDEEQRIVQGRARGDSASQIRNSVNGLDDECYGETHKNEPRRLSQTGYASQITDQEIKTISLKIWNSEPDLDVQYDGKQDKWGNRKLFMQKGSTDKTIDVPLKNLFPFYNKYPALQDPCGNPKSSKACDEKQNLFLDHIFKVTGPVQVLHDNLKRRGIFTDDYNKFKTYLKTMWFTPYSRSGGTVLDSSAFEHVFLGEITNKGDVAGLHNWMRMYLEERGSHFKLNKDPIYDPSSQPSVAKVNFTWYGGLKTESSFFMRKSPAVEIALYTLCFMVRPYNPIKPCWIDLGPFRLTVKAIPWKNNNRLICTAYPV